MTQRLPPDIDRMLWEIAESQDSNAYDDFEKRFPQLVGELGKRIQLVRELRDARGDASHRPLPRFDRRDPARFGPQPKAILALCAATVACIGLGAYVVTSRLANLPKIIAPSPVPLGPPGYVGNQGSSGPNVNVPTPRKTPVTPQTPTQPTNTPAQLAPYLEPQKLVQVDRAKLQVAILLVAASGKLDVEFAPNMPNPDIRMEYRNMSPLDIIKDLGPRFGFTAFREGGNKILLIPKVDPNAAQLPAATGSGYAADIEPTESTDAPGPGKARQARPTSTSGPS